VLSARPRPWQAEESDPAFSSDWEINASDWEEDGEEEEETSTQEAEAGYIKRPCLKKGKQQRPRTILANVAGIEMREELVPTNQQRT
jgi:hypothetical protein